MRVISGRYKGRRLKTVSSLSVRPVTDRVKQTLFDTLATRIELHGAEVLDLFAGSGSLGIEALSRGAASVTFVESDRRAIEHLSSNISMLDCENTCEICEMDALAFLERGHQQYNLIFADPPYEFSRTAEIPRMIFEAEMVKPGGYLLIEHTKDLRFSETSLYAPGPEKRFGRTIVTFFRHKLPVPSPL